MKCYYEELGIPRDASDGDIKSAYRKLALRWHPDKNLECLEEAKERFQLIQQAYEVLSDPQERAWYDNHREQILRGKNSEYEDNCLDLFQYFTSSCFKGYGNEENGFYAVYRKVFETIACEDAEFLDDEDKISSIPSFGNADSSYEETVGPFYAYWSAYSTKRGYEWLCPYDIREIKDRRILREVEKEMKKISAKAKRERNEEVRSLVAFVRKRDRRVHAYRLLLEQRAEENRLKQEQNRIEKIRKRQQELKETSQKSKLLANDDYEEQLKNLQQHYGDESDEDEQEDESDNSNSEAEVYDDLYCIACNKSFKNDKAFANHESSKKHREKVEKLQADMQREEDEFQKNSESSEGELSVNGDDDDDDDVISTSENEDTAVKNGIVESNAEEYNDLENDNPNDTLSDDDENPAKTTEDESTTVTSSKKKSQNKKSKKNKKVSRTEEKDSDPIDVHPTLQVDTDEDDWNASGLRKSNKHKKNKNKKTQNKLTKLNLETNVNEDEEHTEPIEVPSVLKVSSDEEDWNTSGNKRANKNKKNKKSQNKATSNSGNKSTVTDTANAPESEVVKEVIEELSTASLETSESTKHVCVTCKAGFPSKNKLFAHLKSKNHGVYIPKNIEPAIEDSVKSKKSKNKRK